MFFFFPQYTLNTFLLVRLLMLSGYLYFSYTREAQLIAYWLRYLALCEGTNQLFNFDSMAT